MAVIAIAAFFVVSSLSLSNRLDEGMLLFVSLPLFYRSFLSLLSSTHLFPVWHKKTLWARRVKYAGGGRSKQAAQG